MSSDTFLVRVESVEGPVARFRVATLNQSQDYASTRSFAIRLLFDATRRRGEREAGSSASKESAISQAFGDRDGPYSEAWFAEHAREYVTRVSLSARRHCDSPEVLTKALRAIEDQTVLASPPPDRARALRDVRILDELHSYLLTVECTRAEWTSHLQPGDIFPTTALDLALEADAPTLPPGADAAANEPGLPDILPRVWAQLGALPAPFIVEGAGATARVGVFQWAVLLRQDSYTNGFPELIHVSTKATVPALEALRPPSKKAVTPLEMVILESTGHCRHMTLSGREPAEALGDRIAALLTELVPAMRAMSEADGILGFFEDAAEHHSTLNKVKSFSRLHAGYSPELPPSVGAYVSFVDLFWKRPALLRALGRDDLARLALGQATSRWAKVPKDYQPILAPLGT